MLLLRSNVPFGFRISLAAWLAILISASIARAASSETNAASSIPQSFFVQPKDQTEGKDPFYPKSMRPYVRSVPVRTNVPVEPITLTLNGITGPPKRSVMINGVTFEPGEERDVKNKNGAKTHVKCLEIKDESVLIELPGGEKQELRLRAKLY